jgi:type IV fimbrial biogenesis protein FimT
MLNTPRLLRGISMIELMVTVTLAAILLAVAVPAFSTWMQNSRIRVTAEAVLAGLQYAKSEATTRNSQVRFQLTSSVDDSCEIRSDGASWVVDMVDAGDENDSVAGRCATEPSDTVAPRILQTRSALDGSGNAIVQASASNLVFNGLGRLTPTPAAAISIDIGAADGDQCAARGGDLTCLRVLISPAGQLRMCNPVFPEGDPQAC